MFDNLQPLCLLSSFHALPEPSSSELAIGLFETSGNVRFLSLENCRGHGIIRGRSIGHARNLRSLSNRSL